MIHFRRQYRSEVLLCTLVAQIAATSLADSYPVCGATGDSSQLKQHVALLEHG